MKYTTEKIETIRDMLYLPCKIISSDLPIIFSETGISVCAMDRGHICLIVCDIPSIMFSKIEGKDDIEACFNASDLYKILLKIRKSEITTIEIKDNKLIIKQTKGKKISRWSLNMIDLPTEYTRPDLESIIATEHEVSMKLDVSLIKEAISNLEIFDTESAQFLTSKNTLKISTGATNIGDFEYIIEKDELSDFHSTNDASLLLSTGFLKNICAIDKISPKVVIEYSDYGFILFKSISEEFKLWIMLASRADDEEDEDYE